LRSRRACASAPSGLPDGALGAADRRIAHRPGAVSDRTGHSPSACGGAGVAGIARPVPIVEIYRGSVPFFFSDLVMIALEAS
jgi:hypothetical protein